jgi:hypothetical protein
MEAGPSFARVVKIDICHYDEDFDRYKAKRIAPSAEADHRAHGDAQVGEAVPGMAGFVFDDNCAPVRLPTTLTLVKTVINDDGGGAVETDFQASISGIGEVDWSVATPLNAGSYTASETVQPGYTASAWGGDCAANGDVTLAPGDNLTCTITNDDTPAPVPFTIFNNDQAGFNTAVGNASLVVQSTENFESIGPILTVGGVLTNDPLASGVANGPFPSGTTLTGVLIQSNTNASSGLTTLPRGFNALVALGPADGSRSNQVFATFDGDGMDLVFSAAGAHAVSLAPLFENLVSAGATGTVTVRVFDTANFLLGSADITNVGWSMSQASSFVGVVAGTTGNRIGRINLYDGGSFGSNTSQGVDDIVVFTPGS